MQVLDGSLTRVLENPGLIALSESQALALGDAGRVGQSLLVRSLFTGGEQEFEVGAIIRPPESTSHSIEMLTGIGEHASGLFASSPPWEVSTPVRLLLKSGQSTQDLNDQMPNFVASELADIYGQLETDNINDHLFYELQPIKDIYLNRKGLEENILTFGDKSRVITAAVVGLIVLIVGCSNSASLSFANALRRRKEVGIRKVLGAGKKIIVMHYLGDSVLIAMIAWGLAVALQAYLAIPVQTLFNINAELNPTTVSSSMLLLIAVFIGLFNGAYPAFVLSNLRPQSVLKSNTQSGGNGVFRARTVLVGGQLALTIMLMACSFSFYTQLIKVQNQALGYDHKNLLEFSLTFSSSALPDASVVVDEVVGLPGVVAATPTYTVPPNMNLPLNINSFILVSVNDPEREVQATRLMVADGFTEMIGIPLLTGRRLNGTRDSWPNIQGYSGKTEYVLINRSATKALGFSSPESAVDQFAYMQSSDENGQMINVPIFIVGVLEDSLYSSVHRLPVPEFYVLPPYTTNNRFMVRFESSASKDIQENLAALLESYGTDITIEFIDESRIESVYLQQKNESRLLLIAASIAMLLACIGMYGLVSATVTSSVKEVGVRKVLGASTVSILGLFLWRFSRPAVFANLIAWPLAGWFVIRWIQQFPYQVEFIWFSLIFLSASIVVLLVVWITIIMVTVKAAQSVPANSLQYE